MIPTHPISSPRRPSSTSIVTSSSGDEEPTTLIAVASGWSAASNGRVGLYLRQADSWSACLDHVDLMAPMWLTWSPDGTVLYAACTSQPGSNSPGQLVTLRPKYQSTGQIDGLGVTHRTSSGGSGPCHIATSPDGAYLVISHYHDGTVGVLRQEGSRGQELTDLIHLEGRGKHPVRQRSSHPHHAVVDSSSGLVTIVDLGTDRLVTYEHVRGRLRCHSVSPLPPGTGPRQLIKETATSRRWLVGELSGEILTLDEDPPGHFVVTDRVPASQSNGQNFPAHGDFDGESHRLYVSNRGPDTISVFDTSDGTRQIAEVSTPAHPRHFVRIRDSLLVAAMHANEIAVLRSPTAARLPECHTVVAPTCLAPRP